MIFPINRSPTAYAYLFKTGERVFDSRETPAAYRMRQDSEQKSQADDFNKSSTAYAYRFKTGERVFDSQEPLAASRMRQDPEPKPQPYDFNKSPTAYAYRFKTEEQICDNRGTLELDQQQQLLKQRAIDTIIRDIQTNGSWNNLAGEIAPTVVTCLPTWPGGQHLEVRSQGGSVVSLAGKQPLVGP